MAYNEHSTELATVNAEEAELKQLPILSDPAFDDSKLLDFNNGIESTYGHFLCPSCKDPTLVLVKWGNWD